MNTQPDFEELLRLLEENSVRYMIVGGYAVAFHGHARFTKDIDVFYAAEDENIERLRSVLNAFGFTEVDVPASIFAEPGNVITFGIDPVRIDLLNAIDGVTYGEAEANAVRGRYGEVETRFIGRDELLKNKRACGRPQDRADAELLGGEDEP